MARKIIAIDIDDVLSANAEGFIAYSNQHYGTNLKVEDYQEHWQELWDVDHQETERRARHFHTSGTALKYRRIDAAKLVLTDLAKEYRLIVTTSRRKEMIPDTIAWLDEYFSGIFEDVRFSGVWDTIDENSHLATKVDLCQEIGANFLIDDQLKHCVAAAQAGIEALLFGDYPWNQIDKLPKGVTRVADWQEVKRYFDGRS